MDNPVSHFSTPVIASLWKSCLYITANSPATKFSTSIPRCPERVENGIFCIIPGIRPDAGRFGMGGCGNPGQSGRFAAAYPHKNLESASAVRLDRCCQIVGSAQREPVKNGVKRQNLQQNPLIHNFALTTAAATTASLNYTILYLRYIYIFKRPGEMQGERGRTGVPDAGCAAIQENRNVRERSDRARGRKCRTGEKSCISEYTGMQEEKY